MKRTLFEQDVSADVLQSFNIQSSLHPSIWDGNKLKPDIRKRLLFIANKFWKELELEGVEYDDIVLTGSIANYNWSKFSDIDLHIKVRFGEISNNQKVVEKMFTSYKTTWNEHHDIMLHGFEVELYVENIGETHIASGLYSVLDDKWIVVPKKNKIVVDYDDVKTKATDFVRMLPTIQKYIDGKQYKRALKMIDDVKDKVKKMRVGGLQKGGEFSVENLTFKVLRRTDFLERVYKMALVAYDNRLSLESIGEVR